MMPACIPFGIHSQMHFSVVPFCVAYVLISASSPDSMRVNRAMTSIDHQPLEIWVITELFEQCFSGAPGRASEKICGACSSNRRSSRANPATVPLLYAKFKYYIDNAMLPMPTLARQAHLTECPYRI